MKPLQLLFMIGLFVLALPLASPAIAATKDDAGPWQLVPASNADYVYAGRVDFSNPEAPGFYWAGDAATIGFTGPGLEVVLATPGKSVYFDVIVDGNGAIRHVIHCRKGRHVYAIATDLAPGRHTVEVFRRVDPTYKVATFEGIRIGKGEAVFHPHLHHALKIEFYGDSITSGVGVLNVTRLDNGNPAFMDNYVAYDAVAARVLHASYRSISLSGIGIEKSWFPLVMPQMYDRLAPWDPDSHWDFSRWTPDFVVINLTTNDASLLHLMPKPPSKQHVIDAYIHFVDSIRHHYPHAEIICMLGDMAPTRKGTPWAGYIKQAVAHMRAHGDHAIQSLIVPFKNTPNHPDIQEQASMARTLVEKIRTIQAERHHQDRAYGGDGAVR